VLCEQLYQFSPHIELYCSIHTAQSALLLEISSCLALFFGLKNLINRFARFLEGTPHQYSIGLAHTAKAAWLLSFANVEITGEETRATFNQRLNALPIDM